MGHTHESAFGRRVDDLVEQLQGRHAPLAGAMPLLLAKLRDELSAPGAFLTCLDEGLRSVTYRDGATTGLSPRALGRFAARVTLEGSGRERAGRRVLLARALDFAGRKVGVVGALVASPEPPEAERRLEEFAEHVDGYVGTLLGERHKQRLLEKLARALQHPVLEAGVRAALAELRAVVDYTSLLLAYVEEAEAAGPPTLRIISDGATELALIPEERLVRLLQSRARGTAIARLLDRLRIRHFVHEPLLSGLQERVLLGDLVVSKEGGFSTFEADVVRVFQGLVRLRLIDFNRERRGLLRSFSPAHAHRLLSTEGYARRYLTPRRRTVAVMFADLDGFTSISERPDMRPEVLLDVIDRWASGARDLVHAHGGVLDKVIGDCVLAIFGPPFFNEDFADDEEAVAHHCRRALEAAVAVRAFTEGLKVPGVRLRTGTGLNVATLAVGMMSVGDSYTGYGRGMNETARLQDLADGGVILVSEQFRRRLGAADGRRFGPLRHQRVSGIGKPLPFRQLLK